jgi:hypothetical protein
VIKTSDPAKAKEYSLALKATEAGSGKFNQDVTFKLTVVC